VDQVSRRSQNGQEDDVQLERVDVAWLKAIFAVPPVGLLLLAPERPVALGNAVQVSLDGVDAASRIGLDQQACAHFCPVALVQATVGQPLKDLPVTGRLADGAFRSCSPCLRSHRLHVGVEGSSAASAGRCGVVFLVWIDVVLIFSIGCGCLLQAVNDPGQLIQERAITVELKVERGFNLVVRTFLQVRYEGLHLGKLCSQRTERGCQSAVTGPSHDFFQTSTETLNSVDFAPWRSDAASYSSRT